MTSTNDGKDVKSNQTSVPKGKSYYIDLYKSLEKHLSEECELRARTQHLCSAWRRVHSLCQHSAPTTHPHYLAWLQRHTANTLLQSEWQSEKEEHAKLQDAIDAFIAESKAATVSRNGASPGWESQLVQRGEWFKKILANPWGHPVLKVLCDPRGKPPSDEEIIEWLKEERGVMFLMRLRHLAASKKCHEIALSLAAAVMDRKRASETVIPDAEQVDEKEPAQPEGGKPTFIDILRTSAGFTVDVWEMLTDLELVLLHKREEHSKCIALAKKIPLRSGYQLVERLRSRPETSPREKKLWKNSGDVATLVAQVLITRCMVVGSCAGTVRSALYCCGRSLVRLLPRARLPAAAGALAAPAATARHLHTLAAAVHTQLHAQNAEDMNSFVCELYVRAITAGMNELEKLKLKTEKESEARSMEQTLASWFTSLGALLSCSARIHCECALTAFSVHPSAPMYEKIKAAPSLPKIADKLEPKEETKSEFGSWASDSRSQTNLVKTSETLNLKQTQQHTNVMSTAIFAEGEAIGLSAELCQDLTVCLSGPRVKTLSWDMDREILLENCRTYMERTHGGTKALTTELKYLNLDLSEYQHLPEEDDDENDVYYGIEKGYEHLVELQEEVGWQDDIFDHEDTETYSSNSELDEIPVRRKKKTKRVISSENDTDPLNTATDTNKGEKKKERPHSKERSKEKKKKPKDPEEKAKKREKKERKKKEKAAKTGSLSALVGMKVYKDDGLPPVSDSDYDSQGKSSLASEGNDPNVVFDGLFSMDDPLSDKHIVYSELSVSNGQVTVNVKAPKRKPSINKKKSKSSTNISSTESKPLQHAKSISNLFVNPKPRPSPVSVVNEHVKRSITKLLQFRRNQNAALAQKSNQSSITKVEHKPLNAIYKPEFPTQQIISPKSVVVPEIPKSYINKASLERLEASKSPYSLGNKIVQANESIGHASNRFNSDSQHIQTKSDIKTIAVAPSASNSDMASTINKYKEILNMPNYYQNVNFNQQHSVSPRPSILGKSPTNIPPKDISMSLSRVETQRSSEHAKSYENFIKNLQVSANPGSSSVIVSKEESPISRMSPLMPSLSNTDMSIFQQCAKQVPQKKVDNAPHTFSRLTYMKNKQSDMKQKQALETQAKQQEEYNKQAKASIELSRCVTEFRNTKINYIQTKGDTVITRIDNPLNLSCNNTNVIRKAENFPTTSRSHCATPNILLPTICTNQEPVSRNDNTATTSVVKSTPGTSYLSEKDQDDLLLLLRQQTRINAARTVSGSGYYSHNTQIPTNMTNHNATNVTSTTNVTSKPSQSTILMNNNLHQYESTLRSKETRPSEAKNQSSVVSYSNNVTHQYLHEYDKTSKRNTPKIKESDRLDWQKVMNAIIAQKTPSRGPSALELALKSTEDSEKSLRNQRIVRTDYVGETNKITTTVDSIIKHAKIASTTKSPVTCKASLKDVDKTIQFVENKSVASSTTQNIIQNKSIECKKAVRNVPTKRPGEMIRRQTVADKDKFSISLSKYKDPFISGRDDDCNLSDLDDLLDDELRRELGELSSDEDSYRIQQAPKGNKIQQLSKNNNSSKQSLKKDKAIIPNVKQHPDDQLRPFVSGSNFNYTKLKESCVRSQTNKTKTEISVHNSLSHQNIKVTNENLNKNVIRPNKPQVTDDLNSHYLNSATSSSVNQNITRLTDRPHDQHQGVKKDTLSKEKPVSQASGSSLSDKSTISGTSNKKPAVVEEPKKVYLAVPQPASNIVFIGSDVYYSTIPTIQNKADSNLSSVNQMYVQQRVNITTPQLVPCVAPISSSYANIAAVPITIPTFVDINKSSNVCNNPYRSLTAQNPTELIDNNVQTTMERVKSLNKNDKPLQDDYSNLDKTDTKMYGTNSDLNSQRKVLTEVKENKHVESNTKIKHSRSNSICTEEVSKEVLNNKKEFTKNVTEHALNEKTESYSATDIERLKRKRLAILNRQTIHSCKYPPIALSYVPKLKQVSGIGGCHRDSERSIDKNNVKLISADIDNSVLRNDLNTDVIQLNASKYQNVNKLINVISQEIIKPPTPKNDDTNTESKDEHSKENTDSTVQCRRILLRSSNKMVSKIPINVNDKSPVVKKTKVRLKVVEVQTETSRVNFEEDASNEKTNKADKTLSMKCYQKNKVKKKTDNVKNKAKVSRILKKHAKKDIAAEKGIIDEKAIAREKDIATGKDKIVKKGIAAVKVIAPEKDIPTGKDISVDKGIAAEKDMATGKDISVDKGIAAEKDIATGKDISVDKGIAAEKDMATGKDISVDKGIAAEKDIATGKDISVDKGIAAEKDIATEKDIPTEKDISFDKGIATEKEKATGKIIASQQDNTVVSEDTKLPTSSCSFDIEDAILGSVIPNVKLIPPLSNKPVVDADKLNVSTDETEKSNRKPKLRRKRRSIKVLFTDCDNINDESKAISEIKTKTDNTVVNNIPDNQRLTRSVVKSSAQKKILIDISKIDSANTVSNITNQIKVGGNSDSIDALRMKCNSKEILVSSDKIMSVLSKLTSNNNTNQDDQDESLQVQKNDLESNGNNTFQNIFENSAIVSNNQVSQELDKTLEIVGKNTFQNIFEKSTIQINDQETSVKFINIEFEDSEKKNGDFSENCQQTDVKRSSTDKIKTGMLSNDEVQAVASTNNIIRAAKTTSTNSKKPPQPCADGMKTVQSSTDKIKSIQSSTGKLKTVQPSDDKIKTVVLPTNKTKTVESSTDKIKTAHSSVNKNMKSVITFSHKIKSVVKSTDKMKIVEPSDEKLKQSHTGEINSLQLSKEKIKLVQPATNITKLGQHSTDKTKSFQTSTDKISVVQSPIDKINSVKLSADKTKSVHALTDKNNTVLSYTDITKTVQPFTEKIKTAQTATDKVKTVQSSDKKINQLSINKSKASLSSSSRIQKFQKSAQDLLSKIKDLQFISKAPAKKTVLHIPKSNVVIPSAVENNKMSNEKAALPPKPINTPTLSTNEPVKCNIPQSYKDSIIIEEIPNKTGDNVTKLLRVKLPNGKIFKASVYGKMHTSFDTLFDDPSLRAMLMSDLNEQKKYTLNIKQVSKTNKDNPDKPLETRIQEIQVKTKTLAPAIVETIDLLSDDEDNEENGCFKTQSGVYKTTIKEKDVIAKHQAKLDQNCCVSLERLVLPEIDNSNGSQTIDEIEIDGESDSMDEISSPPISLNTQQDTKPVPNVVNTQKEIGSPVAFKAHNIHIIPTTQNNTYENNTNNMIEIDESSNDSIDLLKNCPDLPVELITGVSFITNYCKTLEEDKNDTEEVISIETKAEVPDNSNADTADNVSNKKKNEVLDDNSTEIAEVNCEKNSTTSFEGSSKISEENNHFSDVTNNENSEIAKENNPNNLDIARSEHLADKENDQSEDSKHEYLVKCLECYVPLTRCDDLVEYYSRLNLLRRSDSAGFEKCDSVLESLNVQNDKKEASNVTHDLNTSEVSSTASVSLLHDFSILSDKISEHNHIEDDRNSPVVEYFEIIASLRTKSENSEESKSAIVSYSSKLECDWSLTKRHLHYECKNIEVRQNANELKNSCTQQANDIVLENPRDSAVIVIPSLVSLLCVFFQNTKTLHYLKPVMKKGNLHEINIRRCPAANLKRKMLKHPDNIVASKVSRNIKTTTLLSYSEMDIATITVEGNIMDKANDISSLTINADMDEDSGPADKISQITKELITEKKYVEEETPEMSQNECNDIKSYFMDEEEIVEVVKSDIKNDAGVVSSIEVESSASNKESVKYGNEFLANEINESVVNDCVLALSEYESENTGDITIKSGHNDLQIIVSNNEKKGNCKTAPKDKTEMMKCPQTTYAKNDNTDIETEIELNQNYVNDTSDVDSDEIKCEENVAIAKITSQNNNIDEEIDNRLITSSNNIVHMNTPELVIDNRKFNYTVQIENIQETNDLAPDDADNVNVQKCENSNVTEVLSREINVLSAKEQLEDKGRLEFVSLAINTCIVETICHSTKQSDLPEINEVTNVTENIKEFDKNMNDYLVQETEAKVDDILKVQAHEVEEDKKVNNEKQTYQMNLNGKEAVVDTIMESNKELNCDHTILNDSNNEKMPVSTEIDELESDAHIALEVTCGDAKSDIEEIVLSLDELITHEIKENDREISSHSPNEKYIENVIPDHEYTRLHEVPSESTTNILTSNEIKTPHDPRETYAQSLVSSDERDKQDKCLLTGIEFEDPNVGTLYVLYPIEDSLSDTATLNDSCDDITEVLEYIEDTDNNIRDDMNVDNNALTVNIPKMTYSKQSENGLSFKLNLKRKIDFTDPKFTSKKYRKGKNIDYPKITASAILEQGYTKEYKRVLDYSSSLKFSYTQPFHKDYFDIDYTIKDWPIKDPSVPHPDLATENTEIQCNLFTDVETNRNYEPKALKQTLVEEISQDYTESNEPSSEINEINFNMGFGEGSGRVIQNLEDVGDISKVSAATLSDVKQPQPCLPSEDCEDNRNTKNAAKDDQIEKIQRYITYIKLRERVKSFFRKNALELHSEDWLHHKKENSACNKKIETNNFPFDYYTHDFIEPRPFKAVVQVVQVGQLPVSAAAQNPVTCDPRVTQVSDASPSQCSVENSPHDDSSAPIKTEYTELTTADLSLPLVQDYAQHNQTMSTESLENQNTQAPDENIPIETEIKSVVKIELMEELPEDKEELPEHLENTDLQSINMNHSNDDYSYEASNTAITYETNNASAEYETTNTSAPSDDTNVQLMYNSTEKQTTEDTFSQQKQQNGSSEKTDQIAHAMSAAGITTTAETIANNRAHALVNILSQKIRQGAVGSNTTTANSYPKTTSINAMALQQALAQILPPPLNQTNVNDNNQQTSNTQVTPQVLHIVQGKNASGSQITLVDSSQQSVISGSNATPVLHIVQNKTGTAGVTTNGVPGTQTNSFSGLSLVDAGLQQGGNQLLHIVNTGSQKNNNAGQLIKRVNLLTNLANVQGSNEQKMVQFVCKSADGKSIQLNAPHQRSMVLRLQPIEAPVPATQPKPVENPDLNQSASAATANNKDSSASQQEIKSRSVYEENYAKFIQNSSTKPTAAAEKSTSLPKFNQAFGKPVFQDGSQKANEMSNNMSSVNTPSENNECQPTENNTINLEHISQINSPPLLLRKSPAQTSQAQTNLVQQIKQTIAPMNIQTMHGGVIYTRQIPVNIGGGQTINLITVPSTELIDESGQKQQSDVKFVNQGEIEPSIIKIVPQSQPNNNSEMSSEDSGNNMGVSNENNQNPQPQPQQVLTQMRIKLPMLSKTPQMVSGARVVRPSFFQIQRNVIGGANQPVYQQLVLTAAPPLGQQTIRLPTAQASRPQLKVPSESQSTESMSSSTLEQLREFDMVLEQVKERSTVQPNSATTTFPKLHTSSSDTTDNATSVSTTPSEPTQVLYSIGNNQPLNVAYVNRKATVATPTPSNFVRSPDSSGIADSPTSSTHIQIPHTVTTESTSNESSSQPKPAKVGSKSKSRPKSSSNPPNSMKINPVPPKTSTQKPLEDEQTTQRILYILAEYKEQVENSPDKDKPAPRRRSNPPSNPSGSSKRKKSSSGSRRPGRDMSPIHGDDTCRTMGSEDSSCGTSQGDCNESCLDSHSPQDSPRKIVRKLTFEQETPVQQPRPQPQRNVIVADGQTITVARGTAGKPTTAVLMPANYILPVSMVKGGQQIAIVTNRGPKLLTVGGGEGGATNALLLQRLIGPAGLKPVLARPGVRHVRLPTAALHNLQTFNLATTVTNVQPPDSTASPAPAPTPPELVETRATSSPWADRESQDVKPERGSSPEGSEPWNLPSSADPHDYTYEETVRADNMDRTVLDPIPDRYSPDMEAQRIFDKMFDVDSKKSYIVDSPRCGYDIDASDCDDKAYHQVVQKKDGSSQRHHRLTHVSAAALRHKYAILEHELRLQKSLSEECEDLGVDSPSASELFPEAELLFAASPAHEHQDQGQSHTPQPTHPHQSSIPQPDIDDQIATDQLLPREDMDRQQLELGLEDVGIVSVNEHGLQTIALDHEEFARAHPNTTFHSEPTDDAPVQPFSISGLKGRHITSTIFHSARAPTTVLMTAPQATVISQAAAEPTAQNVKYDIDNMINSLPSSHNNINLSSVLVKDDGLTRFDSMLNDSRELHLTNTASAIVHSTGNATQVIRRVCYDDKRDRDSSFLMDEPDALIAGDDAKMIAEDSSRDATMESMADVDDDRSSPERHTELFWESNSASERSESRRPLDFSSDSDKCCKSPSYDETNSTDSSGVGTHMRLDSVIKDARGIERSGSADGSSADDTHPPLRTYPPKRMYHPLEGEMERSLSGKTRAGERSPDSLEVRRRASGRGVVKRGCHCCNGSPAPPRPKKSRQRKPTVDFNTH